MSVLKAVNYGIRDNIFRRKRKRRRHEIMRYILKIAAAVLFVAGLVLSVINFVENIRGRAREKSEQEKERRCVFSKRIAFGRKETTDGEPPEEPIQLDQGI